MKKVTAETKFDDIVGLSMHELEYGNTYSPPIMMLDSPSVESLEYNTFDL